MEYADENLFRRVHALAARQLETELTPAERQELDALLLESAAARRVYTEYVQETAGLRWLCHGEFSPGPQYITNLPDVAETNPSRSRARLFAIVASLACALAIVGFVWLLNVAPKEDAVAVDPATSPSSPQQADQTPFPYLSNPSEIVTSLTDKGNSVATITGLGSARWSS